MVKIMHISDLHLDSKINGLDQKKREIRRHELKTSFSKAIDLAKKENVSIILIAGDIFDSQDVFPGTMDFLTKTLSSGIPTFISPGNHDFYGVKIFKDFFDNLPENVKVFTDAIECVEIADLNVRVYGRGFLESEVKESFLKGFSAPKDDFINIMVLHGDISSGESIYNPINVLDIANSNLDYLALGHTHTFSQIQKAQNTYYAYSGTHEGRGFDECGEKGVIIGEVKKHSADLKFVPTAIRQYIHTKIDISDCFIIEDIISKVNSSIDNTDFLYKIELVGLRNENLKISVDVILSSIENTAFFVKIIDSTKGAYNIYEIAKEPTLKGVCAKNLILKMEKENADADFLEKVTQFLMDLF